MLPKIQWIKEEHENNLIPKDMGWSVKVIGKTGSGRTTFVAGSVDFFIQFFKERFSVYVNSPTFEQKV